MIPPVVFCMECNRGINNHFQDWDEDNEDGEPQFCSQKCKTAYLSKHDKLPCSWKQADR